MKKKLIENQTYLVNLGSKSMNAVVKAVFNYEVEIEIESETLYSVTPVEIVKDPYGLAKEFALGKSFCVEAKQIREIK